MIRVTMELVPGGVGEPEHLGTILIGNTLIRTISSGGKRGNYDVSIFKKRRRLWRTIEVLDYPRHAYHPWELVRRALNEAALKNGGHI